MAAALDHARFEWEQGHRRLQSLSGDPRLYHRLLGHVEAVMNELRRRVGQTFTLAQLAEAYEEADLWGIDALAQTRSTDLVHAATVEDAAFHAYSRGAVDYTP